MFGWRSSRPTGLHESFDELATSYANYVLFDGCYPPTVTYCSSANYDLLLQSRRFVIVGLNESNALSFTSQFEPSTPMDHQLDIATQFNWTSTVGQ